SRQGKLIRTQLLRQPEEVVERVAAFEHLSARKQQSEDGPIPNRDWAGYRGAGDAEARIHAHPREHILSAEHAWSDRRRSLRSSALCCDKGVSDYALVPVDQPCAAF